MNKAKIAQLWDQALERAEVPLRPTDDKPRPTTAKATTGDRTAAMWDTALVLSGATLREDATLRVHVKPPRPSPSTGPLPGAVAHF